MPFTPYTPTTPAPQTPPQPTASGASPQPTSAPAPAPSGGFHPYVPQGGAMTPSATPKPSGGIFSTLANSAKSAVSSAATGFASDASKAWETMKAGLASDVSNDKGVNANLGDVYRSGLSAASHVGKGILDVAGSALNRSGIAPAVVGETKNIGDVVSAVTPEAIKKPLGDASQKAADILKQNIDEAAKNNPDLADQLQKWGNVLGAATIVEGGVGAVKSGIGLAKNVATHGSEFFDSLLKGGGEPPGPPGAPPVEPPPIPIETAPPVEPGKPQIVNGKVSVPSPDMTMKEKVAGVQPSLKNLIETTPPAEKRALLSSFDEHIQAAKTAAVDPRAPTPLELAGNKGEDALTKLKKMMTDTAEKKASLLEAGGQKIVPGVSDIHAKMDESLLSRFGATADEKGNIVAAPGRYLKLDAPDAKLLGEFRTAAQSLGDNPSAQIVDDFVDHWQGKLYKATKNLAAPADKNVISYAKSVLTDLNGAQQGAVGSAYKAANSAYSSTKQIYDWLNKNIGKDASKGGALMKRVFSPSDAGTKTMFEKIRQLTGVDLVRESTFAKLSMELAGDARQKSLLEQLDVLNPLHGGNMKEKLMNMAGNAIKGTVADPERTMREMIQRSIEGDTGALPAAVSPPKIPPLPKAPAAATAETASATLPNQIVGKIEEIKTGGIFGHTFNLDGTDYQGTDAITTLYSKTIPQVGVSEGGISKILSEKAGIFGGNKNVKIGVFDMGGGNVSVDINIATQNRDLARRIATLNNQDSYWDPIIGEAVKTGGSGVQRLTDSQIKALIQRIDTVGIRRLLSDFEKGAGS